METEIAGFQGSTPTDKGGNDKIMASVKHFAGDGLTDNGTNAGTFTGSSADFARLALAPYIPAVQIYHPARSCRPTRAPSSTAPPRGR